MSSSSSTVSRAKVVISKKIDKRAVRRNLLRRQINIVLEKELPKHAKPLDLVFILKPAVMQMQPDVLQEEVRNLLSKTVLI